MPNRPTELSRDPIAEARRNWERHGWGEVAAPMAAVTSVMRVQQILLARAQQVLKPFRLTFARYEMIALLSFSREKQMLMSKASALLQVHPTSVTNTVDRLEAAGLVERRPHASDRRAVLLILTDEGRRIAEEATRALNEQLFAETGFEAEDVALVNDIFTRFRARSGDFIT